MYTRPYTVYTGVCSVFMESVHSRSRPCPPCTDRVHGCLRPCTRQFLRPVKFAMFTGRKRKHAHVQGTWPVHGRVPGTFTAVYTGRKDDRVHGTRPCMVHGPCTTIYTVRSRPCTAVYTGRKHDHVHSTRPCGGRVWVMYGRVPGPYTP